METVTDPLDMMRVTVNRNLLKHACGTAMFCPQCQGILDAPRAVLITGPRGAWISCAGCWGKGPFQMDRAGWSVLDGRILFARAPRARRARKVA